MVKLLKAISGLFLLFSIVLAVMILVIFWAKPLSLDMKELLDLCAFNAFFLFVSISTLYFANNINK